ncbi:MAG: hypothetical protein H8K04_09840 [Nitrospira sp.]
MLLATLELEGEGSPILRRVLFSRLAGGPASSGNSLLNASIMSVLSAGMGTFGSIVETLVG